MDKAIAFVKNYKGVLSILGALSTIALGLIGFGEYRGELKAQIETTKKYESTVYNNTVLGALVDIYGEACPDIDVQQYKALLQPTGGTESEE